MGLLILPGKWVIFNDKKVALSGKLPISHAYLYLFQRSFRGLILLGFLILPTDKDLVKVLWATMMKVIFPAGLITIALNMSIS